MPPVRQNKQPTSSLGDFSGYCHNDISTPAIQLNFLPLTPETDFSHDLSPDPSPPPPTRKKRSHGKAKPPGHTPRPPNAFIIFRTEHIKAQAKRNSTPEVSKNLGQLWRDLPPSEKKKWNDKAEEYKRLHKEKYPDYKYKPIHRRDEFGNCIRKPRSPNRPRVKKPPRDNDAIDHLPGSFQWLEAKPDADFPSTNLPSDASSVSSPPPSPPPASSLHIPPPSTGYLLHRRSSSVPLAGPDGSFFFGAAPSSVHPSSPGFVTGHAHRFSKRPSTSMDFMCAGLGHSEVYGLPSGAEAHLSSNDWSPWRLGQRRSISAPDFGEIPSFAFPSQSAPQEANPLTPINPVFGNMFASFSWNAPQTSDFNSQNAPADFAPTHPFSSALVQKREEYITVQIPPTACTTASLASNLSSATSLPLSTPASHMSSTPAPPILHPAPVATFDFSAFEEQMNRFEFDATTPAGYGDPLAVVSQTCLPDAGTMYNVDGQFIVHSGEEHMTTGAITTDTSAHQSLPPPTIPRSMESAADLQGYQEGVLYTRQCPEITSLDLNELLVDTY